MIECYDVGGTNINGSLIDKQGNIIVSQSCKTIRGNPIEFVKQIKRLSSSLRVHSPKNIDAVSLGLPGPVENGILIESPPMKLHSRLDLISELNKDIKEPIYIDNDLKTAIRAELCLGIGRRVKNFYLLTISTGIGTGIVLDRKLLTGGTYGEFGHCILERDANKANECGCGRRGCWVAMSSGYGIEITAEKKFKKHLTVEDLFEMYNIGDTKVREIVRKVRDYNAHGIGNMVNAFPVDVIVVMGSIGLNQFKTIIPSPEEISRYTINKIPEIVPTKLGDTIGLLGAYMLAREKLGK